MRVIGGELRGRRIASVPGRETRPSADRLREAVFNILSGHVAAARVLDLFAGTGALGIEALSRGASQAIFIDSARHALAVIAGNLQRLGLDSRARVVRADLRQRLPPLAAAAAPYDLVFMDPPYARQLIQPALGHLRSSGCLGPQARIIVEHSPAEELADEAPWYRRVDRRRYGNSLVSFLDVMV
jgi:16S rRNA (guanine966-N2)-methyltransferase